MNILCKGTMLLYYRSIWPIAREFIKMGHKVYIEKNGHFSSDYILDNPRNVNTIDLNGLKYICNLIGMDHEYLEKIRWIDNHNHSISNKIKQYLNKRRSYSLILGTHKNLLSSLQSGLKAEYYVAIPYAPTPDLFFLKNINNIDFECSNDGLFYLYLREKLKFCKSYENLGLPFNDTLFLKSKSYSFEKSQNRILLLHPGGYRNVLTKEGASQSECIEKQYNFYEYFRKLIPKHFKIAIKLHPLCARWHDYETNKPICDALGLELIDRDEWLGNYIFDSKCVVSFGSSTIYEIAGLGVPILIAGFFGGERAPLYKNFKNFFCTTENEFIENLNNLNHLQQNQKNILLHFANSGDTTKKIVSFLLRNMF